MVCREYFIGDRIIFVELLISSIKLGYSFITLDQSNRKEAADDLAIAFSRFKTLVSCTVPLTQSNSLSLLSSILLKSILAGSEPLPIIATMASYHDYAD